MNGRKLVIVVDEDFLFFFFFQGQNVIIKSSPESISLLDRNFVSLRFLSLNSSRVVV